MNAVTRDARLGSTIGGKYLIASFLAEGGMGTVYAAQHIIIKRRFAVKFLHAELARRRDALARFRREAEAAGALESENVAAVVDFGIATDGAPYIVMEYLEGCDLGRLLSSQGPLPVERAADLVVQACTGIQGAHAAGVIHRDLKPENLFICRRSDGTDLLKIVDFGIAKLRSGDAGEVLTGTWDVVGTAAYMSPEQARGEADLDPRTDVYALGVILYKLLSGRTPHPGDSYNAVLHHISTEEALPLACEDRELPPGLVAVVHRALARDPAERHASAQQLCAALLPWARRQRWPLLASPQGDASREPESTQAVLEPGDRGLPDGTASPVRSTPARVPRGVRRRTALYGVAGLISLAALSGIVAVAGRNPSVRQPAALESSVVAPALPAAAQPPTASSASPAAPGVAPQTVAPAPSTPARSTPAPSTPAAAPARPKAFARGAGRPPPTKGRPAQAAPEERRPAESPQTGSKPESSGMPRVKFDTKNPYD